MALSKKNSLIRRNDRCVCGSGRKYKTCCSPNAAHRRPISRPRYIDAGAVPIRWLIVNQTGTQFFADKDNRAIVFSSQADAVAVAQIEEFSDQDPGDINIAGVGEAKFALLREKIPYIEVSGVDEATALVRERIAYGKAGELLPSEPTDILQAEEQGNGDQNAQENQEVNEAPEGAAGDSAPE